MHCRPIVADEHVPPFAPIALMAPVRLFVGTHLTHPFECVPQTRGKYPC